MELSPRQTVLYDKHSAIMVTLDDEKLVIIMESARTAPTSRDRDEELPMDLISLLGIPAMVAIAVGTILVWLSSSYVPVRRSPLVMAEPFLKGNLGTGLPRRPPR